jgi:hypothetical protein
VQRFGRRKLVESATRVIEMIDTYFLLSSKKEKEAVAVSQPVAFGQLRST